MEDDWRAKEFDAVSKRDAEHINIFQQFIPRMKDVGIPRAGSTGSFLVRPATGSVSGATVRNR